MGILDIILEKIGIYPKPPPTYLEYVSMMNELDKMIGKIDKKIRKEKPNTYIRRYWEKKWEELICLHMEYEWGLHPQNPTPPYFRQPLHLDK